MNDAIEEDDEDGYDYTPPPGPSPREIRRRWASEGNIEALLKLIRETPWSFISIDEQLQNLMAACRAGAKADPEGFSREVFAEMVAFTAYLTLRTQLYVGQKVVGRGAMPCTPALADFSVDILERLVPRLLEMERGMAEVLHAQAVTARVWALARAKEAKAGRPDTRKPARSGRKAAGPAAEVAGEAVVSLPVRGRRRG